MILLVSHDSPERNATARILRLAGYEVLEAATGQEALRLVEDGPELVLLDANLPDFNGYEVRRWIKANAHTAAIPVVHLSASYGTDADRIAALDEGAEACLTQPVDRLELLATVRTCLRLKASEAAVRVLYSSYRALVESACDGIFCVGADGGLLDANAAGCRMLGYTREGLLALNIRDFIASEQIAFVAPAIARVNAGQVMHSEWLLYRKDGTCFSGQVDATALPDGRLVGIVRDLTEFKHLGESRRDRERELLEAQRMAGMGSWEWTPATGKLNWSEGVNHILRGGRRLPSPTFETLAQLYTPESCERLRAGAAKVIQTGLPEELELEIIRDDGTTCWVMMLAEARRGPDGSVVAVRGTLQDIDKRKRAELAVQEEKDFNQIVVDSLPGLFYFIDEHGRLLRTNQNFEDLSGYSSEEISRMSFLDFFKETDKRLVAERMQQVFSEGKAVVEASFVGKDQTETPYLFHGKRFTFQGKPCLVGAGIDITKRKRTEEALWLKTALLEAQAETTIDGILVVDGADRLVFANKQFGLNFGIPDELLSTLDDHIVREFVADKVEEPGAFLEKIKYLSSHTHEKSRDELRFKNGKTFDRYSAPLVDSKGTYWGRIWYFRDITDRKRAEKLLLDSEIKHRVLFEESADANLLMDEKGFVDCNLAALKMFGYSTKAEFLALHPSEFSPPNQPDGTSSREGSERNIATTFLKGKNRFEWMHRRKDGEVFPAEVCITALTLNGLPAQLGTVRDVSERTRAQMELRLQSAALKAAANAIVITDARGTIQWTNPAFTTLTGYLPKEAVGQNPRILQSGIHDESFYRNLWNTILAGNVWAGEITNRKKDGSLYPEEMTVAPVRSLTGEISNFVAVKQDLTNRKQAEKALTASEERFRALSETAPDAIITIDMDGRVCYWNRAAERTLGYSADEAMGRPIHEWLAPQRFRTEVMRGLREFAATGQGPAAGKTLELAATRKDGIEIPIELTVNIMTVGQERYVLGILRDITERKRAETALVKAKEGAEAANRAKSEFLANMSHEIRTPMNGIIGMTDLALDTELNPEQSEYLHMVKGSADALLALLNDILDFSKIEAGKLELVHLSFNLRKSLGEVVKTLAIKPQQKGVELIFDVAPEVPANVVGDPSRLRQVLVNLVGNSIKFTERGEIEVKVQPEAPSPRGPTLRFSIRDTGIGIPADKQQKIFDAFTQADSSTTRKYGGSGLGLTISAQLVGLMGGKLWVESEAGKGSTFYFTAQVGQGTAAVPAESLHGSELAGVPILVVDDNATNRRILEDSVIRWNMMPTVVESAAAAMEVLQRARSSGARLPLVLTDAHMPDIDGFGLVEGIREDPLLSNARIVMLTSGGERGDAERCQKLGVTAYLSKPFDRLELRDVLLHVLAGDPATSENGPLLTRNIFQEQRRSLRFLLAEDNTVNQRLIMRLLEKRGHSVVLAQNGREALEALEKQLYDVILMDGLMPEMDGFEATKLIREKEKVSGTHVLIIALTALAMEGDKKRCLAGGMDGYIAKPVQPEDLFREIDRLCIPYTPVASPNAP
jgi:PAS domain S-box-containing protein